MFHESDLEEHEYLRYKRQVIVPSIRIEGQLKLRNSKVLIVGCGGLGCAVIPYLSGSGISIIGIVDHDKIEKHNLQRQVLFKEEDLSKYKVEVTAKYIKEYNPDVKVNIYKLKIDSFNSNDIVAGYDLILDCSDDIRTRYDLTDSCSMLGKDFICASVLRWEGHIYVLPKNDACYRCLYPVMKKKTVSCDDSGIMGPLCGVFGSLQALEAIKLILGENKSSKMIYYNGFSNEYNNFKLRKKQKDCKCSIFSINKYQHLSESLEDSAGMGCSLKLECKHEPGDDTSDDISWDDVLKNKEYFTILDVRNNLDFKMFRIRSSYNIEFAKIKDNLHEISNWENIVVLCKRGINSRKAVEILKNNGIKAFSIVGGMNEYENRFLNNKKVD